MLRKRGILTALTVLLVITSLVAAGCSSTRSTRQEFDDAEITAKVKAKLIADPQVKAFDIDVDTLRGVVTLQGEVEESVAKREAEQLAKDTEGVVQVVNRIRVVQS